MSEILSKDNCLSNYKWGDNCDGWNFISKPEAVIKRELMPAQTAEKLHFHTYAEQFFYTERPATFLVKSEHLRLMPAKVCRLRPAINIKL